MSMDRSPVNNEGDFEDNQVEHEDNEVEHEDSEVEHEDSEVEHEDSEGEPEDSESEPEDSEAEYENSDDYYDDYDNRINENERYGTIINKFNDPPYRAEYAKCSINKCGQCMKVVEEGSFQLSVSVQEPVEYIPHKMTFVYHFDCFFQKENPRSYGEIVNTSSLCVEDQQNLRAKIDDGPYVSKFSIEYAKRDFENCNECGNFIDRDELTVYILENESDRAKRAGSLMKKGYHLYCFCEVREQLEFYDFGSDLDGYHYLKKDDKLQALLNLPLIPSKKRKAEDEPDTSTMITKKSKIEQNEVLERQNKLMFYYRDLLEKNLKKKELISLLEHNGYPPFSEESEMLDVIADLMTFGGITEKCILCSNACLLYKSGFGYACNGNVNVTKKCPIILDNPKRNPFIVPDELKEAFNFLKRYKFVDNGKRVIVKHETPLNDEESKGKSLKNFIFVIIGIKDDFTEIEDEIQSFGGEVHYEFKVRHTAAIIIRECMIDSDNRNILKACDHGIECVTKEFLKRIKPELEPGSVFSIIKEENIAPWGKDVESRVGDYLKSKSRIQLSGCCGTKWL